MVRGSLEFGGREVLGAPPERVFAVLTDLDGLPRIIPDVQSSARHDENALTCVVRPGFSFLRGTLSLTITAQDMRPPERADMRTVAKGIGTQITIVSKLKIVADGSGSQLNWQAEITELKGLVAAVSTALVKAAADQVIRQTWANMRKELGE